MREARINLTAKGIYDKRMMKLLWQFRCREDAKNFECALQDETINNPVKVFKHTLNFKYRPDIEYIYTKYQVFLFFKDILKSEEHHHEHLSS